MGLLSSSCYAKHKQNNSKEKTPKPFKPPLGCGLSSANSPSSANFGVSYAPYSSDPSSTQCVALLQKVCGNESVTLLGSTILRVMRVPLVPLLLISTWILYASAVIVKTEQGIVEGYTSANKAVNIFMGIPFAQPPTGKLRWRPPEPPSAWSGVLNATTASPACPQVSSARLYFNNHECTGTRGRFQSYSTK